METHQNGKIAFRFVEFRIRRYKVVIPPDGYILKKVADSIGVSKKKLEWFIKSISSVPSIPDKNYILSSREKEKISLALIKYVIRRDGVELSSDSIQHLANTAHSIGVTRKELLQLTKSLIQEYLDGCFATTVNG